MEEWNRNIHHEQHFFEMIYTHLKRKSSSPILANFEQSQVPKQVPPSAGNQLTDLPFAALSFRFIFVVLHHFPSEILESFLTFLLIVYVQPPHGLHYPLVDQASSLSSSELLRVAQSMECNYNNISNWSPTFLGIVRRLCQRGEWPMGKSWVLS